MRILVACESSGIVRDAFRARGHNAVSCDLEASERPGPHIRADVRGVIAAEPWDMMVAFPPCTHLAVSGAWKFGEKAIEQAEALAFVQLLMNAPIERIAIENPVGIISTRIRKPEQVFQPWWFGHREFKATCLWLTNLPKLRPTNLVIANRASVYAAGESAERAKNRSRTLPGVAEAMAEQWGTTRPAERIANMPGMR